MTDTAGSEVIGPGRLGTPTMFPLRPLFVLGLKMAPFSFFAHPPGWVWTFASSVTMQPSRCRVSSSSGIAAISFDSPSTARWPSASPRPLAQALTRCSGLCSRRRLPERRTVLPSIATTSRSTLTVKDCAHRA
jgi:hypothetical protein